MADTADPNDPARYAYLAEGNARQARKRVATKVLIRDQAGAVLLVDPTYKDHWDLPGGMGEANEPPRAAADRELREELDLTITIGRPLLVDWVGPSGPWDDQLVFVFDGGTLDNEQITQLKLSDPELTGYQFVTPRRRQTPPPPRRARAPHASPHRSRQRHHRLRRDRAALVAAARSPALAGATS
jgi:8-oxo-dGTP pyrophosphatase MutT (NUDIX family)